jgi:hypothetical protein
MFRFSLTQLLVFVAAFACALVSLRNASPVWQMTIGLITLLAVIYAVVVGIFDRGPRRAFAVAFLLVVTGYGALVWCGAKYMNGATASSSCTTYEFRNKEFDLRNGNLPTTQLLFYLYHAVTSVRWYYGNTGQPVPIAEVNKAKAQLSAGNNSWPLHLPFIEERDVSMADFASVGHFWWALFLGCLGGQFARFVHLRRTKEQRQQAPG